jgi:hypothetical protein
VDARERARAKIGKLLALARSPGTTAEGASAFAAASKLAEKHGLIIQPRDINKAPRNVHARDGRRAGETPPREDGQSQRSTFSGRETWCLWCGAPIQERKEGRTPVFCRASHEKAERRSRNAGRR